MRPFYFVPIALVLGVTIAVLIAGGSVLARNPAQSLLVNGDFTDWTGVAPEAWQWRDTPPTLSRLSEERLGKPVMSVRQPNALYQDVASPDLRAGDRVVFEGFVRTGEAEMAFADILLRHADRAEPRKLMRVNIPSGGWQYLRIVLRVPDDGPDHLRFAIHMRDGMQSPLLISGLRAYVVPGMP